MRPSATAFARHPLCSVWPKVCHKTMIMAESCEARNDLKKSKIPHLTKKRISMGNLPHTHTWNHLIPALLSPDQSECAFNQAGTEDAPVLESSLHRPRPGAIETSSWFWRWIEISRLTYLSMDGAINDVIPNKRIDNKLFIIHCIMPTLNVS